MVTRCPVKHLWSGSGTRETESKPKGHDNRPVCPLGYGSPNGPSLSVLHCPLCRALLHNVVSTQPCKHLFCKFCIAKFSDCPLCGSDIKGLQPADDLNEKVGTFIDAHCKNPKLLNGQQGFHSLDSPEAFLLQLGLQSVAGGNLEAALSRLEMCQLELQKPQASGEAAGQAGQLAAVCGSQGDCWKALGDHANAAKKYRESIDYLQQCPEDAGEARHALSVSLNKLGDLQYQQSDVAGACGCYEEALAVRRSMRERAAGGPTWRLDTDIISSLVKVGDARKAGGRADASAAFTEAGVLLAQLRQGASEAELARLDMLNMALEQAMAR